jgi:hypothetical protein
MVMEALEGLGSMHILTAVAVSWKRCNTHAPYVYVLCETCMQKWLWRLTCISTDSIISVMYVGIILNEWEIAHNYDMGKV